MFLGVGIWNPRVAGIGIHCVFSIERIAITFFLIFRNVNIDFWRWSSQKLENYKILLSYLHSKISTWTEIFWRDALSGDKKCSKNFFRQLALVVRSERLGVDIRHEPIFGHLTLSRFSEPLHYFPPRNICVPLADILVIVVATISAFPSPSSSYKTVTTTTCRV